MNRRRRVRQKVHAPAYATFRGASQSEMLDLYEVLDISEVGVAVQCALPMKIDEHVDLCLDLAEARGQISATARVVWADSGRLGLGFPALPNSDQRRLREWLFLNAMAGAANAISGGAQPSATPDFVLRPNYTDTLSAAFAVRREAESFGSNLEAVLSLIVSRSQSMLRASGAAIALAEKDAGALICRATIGSSAPPVGAALQIGSGFSGDCVRAGKTLRCDDSETDVRVDSEACRALGVRSMLASPIRSEKQVLGLVEVFSEKPNAFSNNDRTTIESLAETIAAAVNRAGAPDNTSSPPPSAASFPPSPGSVLFAHYPEESKDKGENKEREKNKNNKNSDNNSDALADPDAVRSVRLPRSHLYLLIITAATLALALGFICAPWIQTWIHAKVQARERNLESTVLASSSPQAVESSQSGLLKSSTDSANLEQLRKLAQQGNPVAENAMGLLYAQGDDKQAIKQDEAEAARWFKQAAEHGSVPAQYKLALMLWGGHGIPKDTNKAYFWAVLARAGGQEGSKDLAKVLASGMSRAQALAIEEQAEIWYQQNESRGKPQPGH
jgi:TPR repeat protein